MGAFETFIESKFFFPVLIGMLLLLIAIFVFILIFDRKKEKQYMKELKEELGDDGLTKTIQIPIKKVVKQVVKKDPELTQTIQIPTLKKEEVKEEVKEEKDDKGLDLSKTVAPTVLKENPVNKPVEERTEIAEDAPVVDLKIADTESDESLEATQVIQAHEEAYPDDELIVPEEVKQVEEDEGEEIAAPEQAVQLEDEGTSVIDLPNIEEDEIKQVEVEKPNAFEAKADGNTDINEDIKYEPPKEYTGTKTEILDISDIVKKEE